jgi:cell division septation protein DedD/nucleoid DNA-binding protein
MQNINFHLAYLLTKHECVIIPGLGAFVVSPVNADKPKGRGIICPPACFLGFNSEIKHNDGLLANAVAKEKNISYKEAVFLIRQYTDDLFNRLKIKEIIHIPWIGSLQLSDDNKIFFKPARNLSCNASYYGFTNIYFPILEEVREPEVFASEANKDVIWIPINRKMITYTASVAATILVLFMIPTPLSDHSIPISPQYASIVNFPVKQAVETATPAFEPEILPGTVEPVNDKAPIQETATETINKTASRQYFIVVASLTNRDSAEETLKEFQAKGFGNAAIISSEGKHRIYTDKFEDKQEAETFLIQFRKNNPNQESAWLLGQKI